MQQQYYWRIAARADGIIRPKTAAGDGAVVIIVPSFYVKARNRKEAGKLAQEIIDPLGITEVTVTAHKITGKKAMEQLRKAKSPENS